jgi:hypothetical protein
MIKYHDAPHERWESCMVNERKAGADAFVIGDGGKRGHKRTFSFNSMSVVFTSTCLCFRVRVV